jgi:hypothetical protein
MNQVDGMKQMDIHRGTVCQTASTMTALRAVTPGLLAKDGTNHGTLGRHCQYRASGLTRKGDAPDNQPNE